MSRPIVFGELAHLHVCSVLIALAEKDVLYCLQSRNELALLGENAPANVQFGEPVLAVGGHLVQGAETALRFVADAFGGPALQPVDVRERARMNRALELNYRKATATLGSQIVGRYVAALVSTDWFDPKTFEVVLTDARNTVVEFEHILQDDPFLAGTEFSLADIALSSLLDNIMEISERDRIVPGDSKLGRWWERVSTRKAFQATRPEGGALFGFLSPTKVYRH